MASKSVEERRRVAFSAEAINDGAPCLACDGERFVTTYLYVKIVPYSALMDGSFGTKAGPKGQHVGVRLPEEHMRLYRQNGLSRHYLPALAGDTTGLEAWLRKLRNPRKDGSVQGLRGVIPAERVPEVIEDVSKAIDERHGFGLTSRHCRGHELEDVSRVVESVMFSVGAVQLRWNPGPHVEPLLKTGSPDGRKTSRPNAAAQMRAVVVRDKSEINRALRALLEVSND